MWDQRRRWWTSMKQVQEKQCLEFPAAVSQAGSALSALNRTL